MNSLGIVLQLVVAVEGKTVEMVKIRIGLNTLLCQFESLVILLHYECGGCIVRQDIVVQLGNISHFVVVIHSTLQLVGI